MNSQEEKKYQELWSTTLQLIKASNLYDDAIYKTYIEPSYLYRISDDLALIAVPNNVSSSIISGNLDRWRSCFAEAAGADYSLQIIFLPQPSINGAILYFKTDSINCIHSTILLSAKATGKHMQRPLRAVIIRDSSTTR